MELRSFLKLLKRYLKVLIIVPLLTVVATLFLVRKLPQTFVSNGQISTGLTDQSRQISDPLIATLQDSKVNNQFTNLVELMKLKKMSDMLSYKLIIHDLSDPAPFRKMGGEFAKWSAQEKITAIGAFTTKLQHLDPLSIANPYEAVLNNLLISHGYDDRSLQKTLVVERFEGSDFISVTATTEKPELSAFMVNTLCEGFIEYYNNILKENQQTALTFLTALTDNKRRALDSVTNKLQSYKIDNGVLNLEDQSKAVSTQKSQTEDMLTQIDKDIDSYGGAIKNLRQQLTPAERKYAEADVSRLNVEVTATQDKLHALTDRWARSNYDPKFNNQIDSLQKQLIAQIGATSDQYVTSPLVGRDDLVKQLRTLEVTYDLARYSKRAVDDHLNTLNAEFKKLVPLDATVKSYNFAVDIASKEYQDALNKFNQANLQSNTGSKLLQVVTATPDIAEPSKKKLIVILLGVISLVFCLVVLFVVWYLDDSVKNPAQLANISNLPVLGYLNRISGPGIDLKKLWDVENRDKMQQFKDLLRAIRFEIDQELNGDKILAVTSMKDGEGKTLVAISLAYSYSMINKKVLLIDGNFEHPGISETANPKAFIEDIFKNEPGFREPLTTATGVIGNHGNDITLLEISDEQYIHFKLNELKRTFDVIIIEAPSLDTMNKAKEWLLFANKFITVFEAGQTVLNGKKQMVRYVQGTGRKFAGWVLNKASIAPKKRH